VIWPKQSQKSIDRPTEADVENDWFQATCTAALDSLDVGLQGKRRIHELILAAVIAGGHVLIEDVPGTGKSVLAAKLAELIGGSMSTVYFTPDILPSDLTGMSVYNRNLEEFEFARGPLFANCFLGEALNRASPKTQSALLSAMEAGQISTERRIIRLPDPFFVIAVQNPLDEEGTYPLPQAQLDRFLLRLEIGYPPPEVEQKLIQDPQWFANRRTERARQIDIERMKRIASNVLVAENLARWIHAVITATREHPATRRGASVRAARTSVQLAQVWAALGGRDYVVPDDYVAVAIPALAHRIHLTSHALVERITPVDVIQECLSTPLVR
jgi:MoxR-like ATPase